MPSRRATIDVRCDADAKGHHAAEVAFWVPLTDVVCPTAALWLESSPGAGDFAPRLLRAGQALRFNGSMCRYHTQPNTSGRTNVAFDLRVVPATALAAGESPPQRIGDACVAFATAAATGD